MKIINYKITLKKTRPKRGGNFLTAPHPRILNKKFLVY